MCGGCHCLGWKEKHTPLWETESERVARNDSVTRQMQAPRGIKTEDQLWVQTSAMPL